MQQLKISEFSGISFSPVNATASRARSDKSASFPQHLTLPLKPECPHCRSGRLLEGSPQGTREGLKAPHSTSRVVLTAGHQDAGSRVFKKAQGDYFFWRGGKQLVMKLQFDWGAAARTCTLAAQQCRPWAIHLINVLFQENIKGALIRQNIRIHLLPSCAFWTRCRLLSWCLDRALWTTLLRGYAEVAPSQWPTAARALYRSVLYHRPQQKLFSYMWN